MSSRTFFNYMVMVITILTVNLLTGAISDYLMHYKGITSPYKFTAIGMLVIVAILFPAFKFMDGLVRNMTHTIIKKGKHVFGKMIGTILIFILLLFILFCFYAKIWYNKEVLKDIFTIFR